MPPLLDLSTEFGARADRRLRDELIGWLVTVNPAGAPVPVPVWFLWDGAGSLLIYSRPNTAKLRNIAAGPRVSVHLDGDGAGGDVVVVSGRARISDDPGADSVRRLHREVRAADQPKRLDAGERSRPTTRCRSGSM